MRHERANTAPASLAHRALGAALLALPLLAAALSSVDLPTAHAAESVAVVANLDVPDRELDEDRVQRIYLGKVRNWSNGKRIVLVTLRDGEVHQAFLKRYVGRTPSQFRNYWRQRLFSGQGTMPVVLETEEEVIEYVARTKGAIGYVGRSVPRSSVAAVQVK